MEANEAPAELSAMLGRDYWLVLSKPTPTATESAIRELVPEHIEWLLGLEREQILFVSGPLLSGPGVGPGSGVTVLRATSEGEASRIAAQDPFVTAELRVFEVYRWRLNEGSVSVRVSLGTGRYEWA